jgi:hypothetical protein
MIRFRLRHWVVLIVVLVLFCGSSACNQKQEDRELAEQYCGSCHLFPEPNLLDKKTWIEGVMPQMAIRMGLSMPDTNQLAEGEYQRVLSDGGLPTKPLIGLREWKRIWRFYREHAPSKALPQENRLPLAMDSNLFKPQVLWQSPAQSPTFSMLKFDSLRKMLLAGMSDGRVYKFEPGKKGVQDSLFVPSSPSDAFYTKENNLMLLLMGKMDPNDQFNGLLFEARRSPERWDVVKQWVPKLNRPVNIKTADLNEDGQKDWIISEFGHYLGKLAWYTQKSDGREEENVLLRRPGTRLTQVIDLDIDGKTDILALLTQSDEQVIWFKNKGGGNFEQKTLLRFPPVYGSSYLEVADMNGDGSPDLIYSAGDNYDYSYSLKKYHGIRLFLNRGQGKFEETQFFPLHGASKVLAADFNQDQLIDFVAIAYFPDYQHQPLAGLVFFKNLGQGKFSAHTLPMGDAANWLLMEKGDLDADGDLDLVLGAGSINNTVPKSWKTNWEKQGIGLLVLENQTK